MRRIKLITILIFIGLVGTVLLSSQQFASKAKGDSVLEQIASYRNWTKVSKEPIKVNVTIDSALSGG